MLQCIVKFTFFFDVDQDVFLFAPADKTQGFKRLNPLGFPDDKIPPKSPRPRRNIWLSRSQSDIFSCKRGRRVNVQDPYYNPPCTQRSPKGHKINPFNARQDLCGGKVKFYDVPSKSVFSLVFDLHSPPGSVFSSPGAGYGPPLEASYYWQQLPGRQCHSLPVSPQLSRSEAFPSAAAAAAAACSSSSNNSSTVTCSQNSTSLPGELGKKKSMSSFSGSRNKPPKLFKKKKIPTNLPVKMRRCHLKELHNINV